VGYPAVTLTAWALTAATRAFPANVAVIEIEPFRGAVTVVLNPHAVVMVAVLRATRLLLILASTVILPVQPSAFVTVLGSRSEPEIVNRYGELPW
jgi:hypothetical protein